MKNLVKTEIIIGFVVIAVFAVMFTLFGDWFVDNGPKHSAAIAATAAFCFFGFIAISMGSDIIFIGAITFIAVSGFVIGGVVAITGTINAIAINTIAIGAIAIGTVAATSTSIVRTPTKKKLKLRGGKVALSLSVQAIIIFGSISAMVFI
ncbi:hypothetical protein ISR92_01080 [Patescibacteria group bacterium]|nr:hypothetical protein [Patescibacteria group bacterium]